MSSFDTKKWERGMKLSQQGNVKIEEIDNGFIRKTGAPEGVPVIRLRAKVRDENSYQYQVSAIFSEDGMEHADCICQEYRSSYYDWNHRYCSHIAAAVIVACQMINLEEYDLYSGQNAHQLVNLYTKDAVVQAINQVTDELVSLEPCLVIEQELYGYSEVGQRWSVSFKIGGAKKYVIKNLTKFGEMMKYNQTFSYGKDLELTHSEDIFEEESKPLLHFILSKVEETKALSDSMRYGYEVSLKRDIVLTTHNIDEFMDDMIGKSIPYTLDGKPKKKRGTAVVVDENPQLHLEIVPDYLQNQELAGVKLALDATNIFQGNQAMYQLQESKLYRSERAFVQMTKPLIEVMNRGKETEVKIGKALLASFYGDVLPKLAPYMEICEIDGDKIREVLPEKVEMQFYFDVNLEKRICCMVEVKSGEEILDFFNDQQAVKYSYAVSQARVMVLLEKYIEDIAKSGLILFKDEEELVYDFMYQGIEQLMEIGTVHGTDKFKNIQVKRTAKIAVGVQMKSDLLNLTIDTQDFDLKELKDILASYHRKKKYHRLKSGSFLNIQDDAITYLADLVEGLHVNNKDLAKGKVNLPAYRALYVDKILQESQGIEYERNQKFKSLVRDFKAVEDSDYEVPTQVRSILRNYQKTGYRWLRMIQKYGLGGILADDMGLGKTLQVITLLLSMQEGNETGTSLVISPASLVYNWESEFAKFAPSLKVGIVSGTPSERADVIENSEEYDVLVTSYDLVKRDIQKYEEKKFFYEIIDEAQYIKNHTTQVSKSVKIIQATHKLALTGTPIENRLSELWSIFDYLMPGFLHNYETFRKEIETPIVKSKDEQVVARLKKLVSPFILRRLKKDVLKDLPDKLEETTFAKMEKGQQQLYTAYVAKVKEEIDGQEEGEFDKNKLKILAELTRLRQLCCDPRLVYEDYQGESAKLETCMELIENARDGGHKVLLFSQFTSMLAIISERLKSADISYYEITGATPKAKRLQLVDAFNANDVTVFLISLKAGGTGLNLTGADVVIHYDPWWNVAAQNQATDRAHRIGQTNVVTVFQLIAKGTIEEKIVKMQENKKKLADDIISGEENQLSTMTRDDFIHLFD